jgi:hypothetical protein
VRTSHALSNDEVQLEQRQSKCLATYGKPRREWSRSLKIECFEQKFREREKLVRDPGTIHKLCAFANRKGKYGPYVPEAKVFNDVTQHWLAIAHSFRKQSRRFYDFFTRIPGLRNLCRRRLHFVIDDIEKYFEPQLENVSTTSKRCQCIRGKKDVV